MWHVALAALGLLLVRIMLGPSVDRVASITFVAIVVVELLHSRRRRRQRRKERIMSAEEVQAAMALDEATRDQNWKPGDPPPRIES